MCYRFFQKLNFISLGLLFLASCGLGDRGEYSKRDIRGSVSSVEVNQYFLADLPSWANFSSSGKCYKSHSIRYIDYERMGASYGFSYYDLVQFQYSLNRSFAKYKKETDSELLLIKDEQNIFYNTLERIEGKVYPFIMPKFDRIHLIWVDPALESATNIQKLKKLAHSPLMDKGVPIFVSMCLSSSDLEEKMKEWGLSQVGGHLLPAEVFSPFDSHNKSMPTIGFDFEQFFGRSKKIYFYSITKISAPPEFIGDWNWQIY